MRQFTRSIWGSGAAVFAAYMLVVQAMLGAFAMGAANATPGLDIFGNPLCLTSMDGAGEHESPKSAVPECCSAGCSMFAPITPSDPTEHALDNPLDGPLAFALPLEWLSPDQGHEYRPGRPRAPPIVI